MTHATVIATVKLNGATAEQVRAAVADALAGLGAELIPCGWAPDLDTVAECTDLAYDDLTLVDLNPNLARG